MVYDYVGRWSDELLLLAENTLATDALSFSRVFHVSVLPFYVVNNCTDSYSADGHLCQWTYQLLSTNLQMVVCLTERHLTNFMPHGILWSKLAV